MANFLSFKRLSVFGFTFRKTGTSPIHYTYRREKSQFPGGKILGKYRIMGQGDSARDFAPSESMENVGIQDVFPIFHTARLEQKIRWSPQPPLCSAALIKSLYENRPPRCWKVPGRGLFTADFYDIQIYRINMRWLSGTFLWRAHLFLKDGKSGHSDRFFLRKTTKKAILTKKESKFLHN